MATGFKTHLKALIIKRASETGDIPTQKEISEATGITQATLSRWNQGHIDRLEFDTVKKLMIYFGCKFDELVTVDLDTEKED